MDYVFLYHSFLIENIWCYLLEDHCVALVHTLSNTSQLVSSVSVGTGPTLENTHQLQHAVKHRTFFSRKLFKFYSSLFHPFNLLSKLTLINPSFSFYHFISMLTIKGLSPPFWERISRHSCLLTGYISYIYVIIKLGAETLLCFEFSTEMKHRIQIW